MYLSTSHLALLFAVASGAAAAAAAVVDPGASYNNITKFREDMLVAHNFFRAAHNASDLRWNETLAKVAEDWSEGCDFKHSGGPTGENLALGYMNATQCVDAWSLERTKYNFDKPGFASETGHFTQVVWRNTTTVGCGLQECSNGWLVVCEYWPAGNVLGAGGNTQYFRDNVLKQVEGKATDTVESGVSTGSKNAAGRGSDVRWGLGVFMAATVVCLGIVW